jgi:DNA end-binding protein Ku
MRTIWKGAITFGLVSIPVALSKATQEHRLALHLVHAADGGRIRQKRVCEVCGEEVPYAGIAKGYEDGEGRRAVLTDEDLAGLPVPGKKTIEVLAFVDADEIDPLMLSSAYYLDAGSPAADKPYALLREALAEGGRAAVARITLSTRESLALLRVHDGVMTLHTMYWPDEIRSDAGLGPSREVTIRPQERKMAASLMATLSEDFDLQELHDDYQNALERLVAARLEGRPVPESGDERAPDNVIDLTAALRASLKAGGRGGHESPQEPAEPAQAAAPPKRPARRTAARAAAKPAGSGTAGGGTTGAGQRPAGSASRKKTTATKKSTAKGSAAGSRTADAPASSSASGRTASAGKKAATGKKAPAKKTTRRAS